MKIREEAAQDIEHIGLVSEQAFAGVVEARLVNELRQNDKIVLSLVALVDGQLVGHILFSPMQIVSPAGKSAGGRSANGPSFAIRKVALISKTGFGLDSCKTVPESSASTDGSEIDAESI